MKTYLVTGAAGFIGANFLKYILKKYVPQTPKQKSFYNFLGYEKKEIEEEIKVVVVDALTYAGNLGTIKEELKNENVKFEKVNICDKNEIERIFKENEIDYVVNFAAESHVDRAIENPQVFLETNILGTQNLLENAKKAWTISKDENGYPVYKDGVKYLQVSTDEVYGSLTKDYDEAIALKLDNEELKKVLKDRKNLKTYGDKFFTEKTPLDPRSPYSASKTGADHIVIAYGETYKLPINITRCSNNYGPYHFPEKLIPLVIKNILEGKKIPVYGRGDNVRDWLYVEDHCKGIDLVLRKAPVQEIYNIGGFNEEQNINIVKLIIDTLREEILKNENYKKILKIDIEKVNYDLISYVQDRLGHDMRYAIDSSKIAKELGWYPETDFETGIKKTVKWYLDNQAWVREVVSGDYQKYYDMMYGNK
ncbi:MAG: dTDP-glucose 4,6-dehydratase [Fusobacterium sp.]|nr:dTDP-glucose 4,6-dehydratase [Fusobacterium sp.]